MEENNVNYFLSSEPAISYLKSFLKPQDVVLFKGSRAMNLDKVIESVFGAVINS